MQRFDLPGNRLFSMPRSKLMSERSNAESVWVFLILPPVLAMVMLAGVMGAMIRQGATAIGENRFGLLWCVIVLPAIAVGLPAVGWRELQKRKQLQKPTPTDSKSTET